MNRREAVLEAYTRGYRSGWSEAVAEAVAMFEDMRPDDLSPSGVANRLRRLDERPAATSAAAAIPPDRQCHAGFVFRTGDFSHAECNLVRGHEGAHRDAALDFWWEEASASERTEGAPK